MAAERANHYGHTWPAGKFWTRCRNDAEDVELLPRVVVRPSVFAPGCVAALPILLHQIKPEERELHLHYLRASRSLAHACVLLVVQTRAPVSRGVCRMNCSTKPF